MIKFEDLITNRSERSFTEISNLYGLSIPRNQIIPGYFYSFKIIPDFNLNENLIPKYHEEWLNNPTTFITDKQYYDLNPIGLLFFNDNFDKIAIILNLKILPPLYRIKLLATYYFLTKKFIHSLYKDSKLIPYNERGNLNIPFYSITQSILKEVSEINFNYAINKYRMEIIQEVKLIDWDNFGELPLAKIDDSNILFANTYNLLDIFNIFEEKQ